MKSIRIENISWIELDKLLGEYDTVVFAIGARTKEHGPHLQLNNDYILAEKLLDKVMENVSVLVLPTLQYGYYPAFLEYPGSVSIRKNVFRDTIIDICHAFINHGVRKFYILNTGISTVPAIEEAKNKMKDATIAYLNLIDFDKTLPDIEEQEGGTHADELETSMMLYLAPETVDMKLAVKDYHPDNGYLSRENVVGKTYSKTGIFGDPTLASVDKGKIIVDNLIKYITEQINSM